MERLPEEEHVVMRIIGDEVVRLGTVICRGGLMDRKAAAKRAGFTDYTHVLSTHHARVQEGLIAWGKIKAEASLKEDREK